MMSARMMVEKPEELEMTLKLTMPMKDWESLRDQLTRAYPSWKLSGAITEMLARARKIYFAQDADAFNSDDV